jgi:DNA-binding transcriptional MerR regulator
MVDGFTTQQVVALTGITARQLQWWDEQGVVRPQRQGRRRLYTEDNLMELAVIAQLRRKGFSLQGVRKVIRFLGRELKTGLAAVLRAGSDMHLLTDGKRLYLETSERQIVDILRNSRQPILGICLSDAVRRLRAELVLKKVTTSVTLPSTGRRVRKSS